MAAATTRITTTTEVEAKAAGATTLGEEEASTSQRDNRVTSRDWTQEQRLSKVSFNECFNQYIESHSGFGRSSHNAPRYLGRKACTSYPKLGKDHTRPLGPGHSSGLLHRIPDHTLPNKEATPPALQRNPEPANNRRSRRTSAGRGCGRGGGASRGILLNPVLSPQKGWRTEASNKPKGLKLLHTTSALQDGRDPYLEGTHETRRLVCKARPEGCILHNTHAQQPEEVPKVCAAGQNIRVQVPPFRSLVGSLGLYQDPEASCSTAAGDGSANGHLHRRHSNYGGVHGTSTATSSSTHLPPRVPGVCNPQRQEVSADTSPGNGFFGLNSRLGPDGTQVAGGENKKYSSRGTKIRGAGRHNSSNPLTPPGKDAGYIQSNPPSTTLLSPPANGPDSSPGQEWPGLRDRTHYLTRGQRGAEMVGQPHVQVEWEEYGKGENRPHSRVRCIPNWLGSSMHATEDRRSMVRSGIGHAYQLPRAAGSNLGTEVFCKTQDKNICFVETRQHHSSGVYKQSGGHGVQRAGSSDKGLVDVVPGEEYPHPGSASPRYSECDSRCGVSDNDRPHRLETESNHIQEDRQPDGSIRSRPLCLQTDSSVPSLLQLAARSFCTGNRCPGPGLDTHQGLCEPTLGSHGACSVTHAVPTGSSSPAGTNLEDTTMVSSVAGDASGLPTSDSTACSSDKQPVGNHPPASRMAYLREKYRGQELSEEASSLLLSSWRAKTNKSYDSLFGKWYSWCHRRHTDPFSGPVTEVANFLAHLFTQGYSYNSLNSYRSAISSVHEKRDGYDVGQHPLVTRLLKGVFNDRPPLPRYSSTWNVQTVLNYLEQLGPNKAMSWKHLTFKTVMLLALTRPSRSADLSQLDVGARQYTPEGVTFTPRCLSKQSRQGKPIARFFFPSFPDNPRLCPVVTLRAYEKKTEGDRGEETRLLLSIIRPHKPVTSSTVARWLKSLLELAGVDTSIFSAHSTRGASASMASRMGVTTNDILQAANWSSESVFQKYYHKVTQDTSYGRAVLSGRKTSQ